jgi:hypothetical protein
MFEREAWLAPSAPPHEKHPACHDDGNRNNRRTVNWHQESPPTDRSGTESFIYVGDDAARLTKIETKNETS